MPWSSRDTALASIAVARLMRQDGIGVNTLDRPVRIESPNRVWAEDLAVVLDLYSHRMIGWTMGHRLNLQSASELLQPNSSGEFSTTPRDQLPFHASLHAESAVVPVGSCRERLWPPHDPASRATPYSRSIVPSAACWDRRCSRYRNP